MYDLYPYFTNDGTVGLFSRQDDDIYHSTYGALSETWQKFILPSHLEQYLATHDSVKILDICYGIGYNTKAALNVYLKYSLEKNTLKNKIFTENRSGRSTNIAAIDSDNILKSYSSKKNIFIDAVDSDKTLINLSPFIANASKFNFLFKQDYKIPIGSELKLKQISNIKNAKKFIKNEYKLKKEVSIILFKKLIENNFGIFDDAILQTILHHKKYAPFLSKFMLNFAKFYQNQEYNYNKNQNKSAFLHNIYYQYISKSNKRADEILNSGEIDMHFFVNDARDFIQTTNNTYNFIYLDAFTPAKCPALWTIQFFKELYSKLEDDGMILTYSNSAAVRNAFLQNGFYVGKTYDSELKKFVGTVAVKNKLLIEHELTDMDLGLINSKAGICFKDENLNLDNPTIIENREKEIKNSNLISSSKVLKGYKNDNIRSV